MKYKVLLIEDSPSVSFYNKLVLQRSQLFSIIRTCVNGKEALKIFEENFIPDIIFLDINMPVMNGWEFLDIYSKSVFSKSPVLMLLNVDQDSNDLERLKKYPVVKGVKEKMLSLDIVKEIKDGILEV